MTSPVTTRRERLAHRRGVLVGRSARRRRRPAPRGRRGSSRSGRRAPACRRRARPARRRGRRSSCSAGATTSSARSRLDGGEQVGGRRVHRLAALDDPLGAEVSNSRRLPSPATTATTAERDGAAGHGGEQPLRALARSARACSRSRRPRSCRARAERERGAGVVGVDVHLQRGRVADQEQRIAEPLELRLECVVSRPSPSITKTVQ